MRLENSYDELVLIPSFKGIKCISLRKIISCEAFGNYTKIHQFDSSFTTNLSLKHVEQILPPNLFYRCHKSYIINFLYFSELHIAEDVIYLENKTFVKLSKHKKKEFVLQLNAFVEANNAKISI